MNLIKRLRVKKYCCIALALIAPFHVQSVWADSETESLTSEQAIVAKVIKAYGGPALTSAHSIKIIDYNKGPWPGESEHPGIPEIWRINEELTIDFKNQRKSLLSYRVPRTDLDLEKWIFDGEKGIRYDIFAQKYDYKDWVTFDWLGGSIVRTSDTMLARQLDSDLKSAFWQGHEFYRGLIHDVLAVTLQNDMQFTYFVEQASGLITRVVRQHPRAGVLTYIFANHQQHDGVTYAADMNFFVDGELRLTSVYRGIELNPSLHEAFSHMEGFSHWGETIDTREMIVKEIAAGVWQAGKGRTLSVFVEHRDHFIAFGEAKAVMENFAALQNLMKTEKPLSHLLVTHHHKSNLQGLDEMISAGIKLIVSQAHVNQVLEAMTGDIDPLDLVIVPDRTAFTLGRVQLFDIATAHSKHYLMAYLPESKIVYDEAHYESNLLNAEPRFYNDTVIFRNALEALNLDVETLVNGYSWRQFSLKEFRQFTDNVGNKTCPKGYAVCAKG